MCLNLTKQSSLENLPFRHTCALTIHKIAVAYLYRPHLVCGQVSECKAPIFELAKFDERKWLLKCYWKEENVVEVQRSWMVEFGTQTPTRVTVTRIRDKFEVYGTMQDVLKGRRGIN